MQISNELKLLSASVAFAAAWLAAGELGGFNDDGLDSKAAEILRKNAFHPIEVGGYGRHACGRDGPFSTRFKAVSPGGQVVTGAVCEGFFSGASIKLD